MPGPEIGGRLLAQGWCALSLLHDRIDAHLERALQAGHDLSVREYSALVVLTEQNEGDFGHLSMSRLAETVSLSQSATTRLVTRLEDRGLLMRYLCPTDRRGIYTNVTDEGRALFEKARVTNDRALEEAFAQAEQAPELRPLVAVIRAMQAAATA
ncbi:MarR family winged helix-turn-helix transcriptional regulator [Yinghuangia seranimata]|uniref:MarR family winged helix-turn-helix transcriptional regulator n=1 Tax=Yinghuangia seranimata TaxID=408067 RepID=UPI00248AE379|nr:MarR family transcriptional regulator [Yinghuangia seranimata]MDI2127828.1 MarR family transcriptional regulator [Yinghuangia seranimata]